MLDPMRDKKLKERTGAGEGKTPVTTACPAAGKYKCEKIKKIGMIGNSMLSYSNSSSSRQWKMQERPEVFARQKRRHVPYGGRGQKSRL